MLAWFSTGVGNDERNEMLLLGFFLFFPFFFLFLAPLFFFLLLGAAFGGKRRWHRDDGEWGASALDILEARYANGEIDRADYLDRKRDLASDAT